MTEHNFILAGDVGGTKTNLAVYSAGSDLGHPLFSATYASGDYGNFGTIIAEFLADSKFNVQRAAFGVAGPVLDGRAKITKLPWIIDRHLLEQDFGLSQVIVVNDLVATAYGLPALGQDDFVSLNPGIRRDKAPQVIIAPGTGLGESFMLWENGRYRPYSSEGGHTPFAPADELQDRLLAYLRPKYSTISNDLVGSGRGIPLLYEFLRDIGYAKELEAVARKIASRSDQTPAIVQAAMSPQASPLCVATLDLFVSILASESANLALKIMATGGIFLGGGMPPRILPFLKNKFMTAFIGQDTLRELLADMPVQVIMEPRTALLGAARLFDATPACLPS